MQHTTHGAHSRTAGVTQPMLHRFHRPCRVGETGGRVVRRAARQRFSLRGGVCAGRRRAHSKRILAQSGRHPTRAARKGSVVTAVAARSHTMVPAGYPRRLSGRTTLSETTGSTRSAARRSGTTKYLTRSRRSHTYRSSVFRSSAHTGAAGSIRTQDDATTVRSSTSRDRNSDSTDGRTFDGVRHVAPRSRLRSRHRGGVPLCSSASRHCH